MTRWHIVTGEYPPQPGGVADYTRQTARELARAGDEVHVWAPECDGATPSDPGVVVERLPGRFGRAARRILGAALDRSPRPFRLLVEYVPHMYGMRGMNVPFCLWLRRRRGDRFWVMFHEVAFAVVPGQKLRHNFLGRVQHWMAKLIAGAADRVWISIPGWEPILGGLAPNMGSVTWLPVPSDIPTEARAAESAAIRARLGVAASEYLIGHFGTFGTPIADSMAAILPMILHENGRHGLLLGRGSQEFLARVRAAHPEIGARLHAAADLDGQAVADHLAACDVLVQPYPDGVSSRRTSVMSSLALGLPIVTSEGFLTEPIWRQRCPVALVPAGDAAAHAATVERLLALPDERRRLGERARNEYFESFSVENMIRKLRSAADDSERASRSER